MKQVKKPHIENINYIGNPGKIEFLEYDSRQGTFDDTDTLLDGDLKPHKNEYACIINSKDDNYIIFKLDQRSNIYAYGTYCYDSGGHTPSNVDLFKLENNNQYKLILHNIPTYNDKWYLLFNNLEKGTYKIKYVDNYVNFTEWYIEDLENIKILIEDNDNNIFSCNSLCYFNKKFNKICNKNEIDINTFKTYGFNKIKDILNEIKIIKNFGLKYNNEIKYINFDDNINSMINVNEIYSKNIINNMRSNNDNDIKISASSIHNSNYDSYYLFTEKKTKDGGSCWATENGTNTGWIMIEFKEPINISKISLLSRDDSYFFIGETPNKIKIFADNKSITDDNNMIFQAEIKEEWNRDEEKIFYIKNDKKYKFYKFYFENKENSSWICIDKMKLYSKISDNKYLIEKDNKLYSIIDNDIIEVNNIDNLEKLIPTVGFDDISLINNNILLSYFKNLKNIKIFNYSKQRNNNIFKYYLKKSINPISFFNKEYKFLFKYIKEI